MAPEVTGDGNGSSATEATQSKPRKRKKSTSSMEATQNKHKKRKKFRLSGSAAESITPSLPIGSGDGNGERQRQQLAGDGQQLQQRGKARLVWTDELHNLFLKAYNVLGEDAVPKKILAMMNVDGLTRENVASHLQKHRLSLKREEQRIIPNRRHGRPPLHAEASNQMPSPSLHPPAQEPPASSSLHPLLPPQAPPFAAPTITISPLQIDNGQQLLQTPQLNCCSSNDAATNLLLQPLPGAPMVQLIHGGFAPPQEATATIAVQLKFFDKPEGERDATVQQDAAGPSGYYPMHVSQAVSMTAVPEVVNMRYQEEEIHMVQMQMAAKAEEGQGRAADPGAADAGSLMSSPGNSIHRQYWKSDGVEVSWDYFGLPLYKPD